LIIEILEPTEVGTVHELKPLSETHSDFQLLAK